MPITIGMFIPVYHREDKVRRCFESLLEKLQVPEGANLHVRVGYNGGPPVLKEYLTTEVPARLNKRLPGSTSYEVYEPGRNLGKPKIVNHMATTLAAKTPINWVLSFDSDLVLVDSFLDRLLEAYAAFPEPKRLGALSANQLEGNCHRLTAAPVVFSSGKYTYVTQDRNQGVAGGALLTPYHVWKSLGGYRAHRVYASDDGDYTEALAIHNLLICMVKEVAVVHPHPALEDPAYFEWKRKAVQNSLSQEEAEGPYR